MDGLFGSSAEPCWKPSRGTTSLDFSSAQFVFFWVSETKPVIVEQDMVIGLTQTQTQKVICRELAYQHMIRFIPDLEVEETSVGERVQKRSIPSALSVWTAAQMLAFFWPRESFSKSRDILSTLRRTVR